MTPRWPHVTSTWPRDALSELSGSDFGALSYPRLKGRRNESLTEDGFGAQDGPKLAPDSPNLAPRWLTLAQKSPPVKREKNNSLTGGRRSRQDGP